jgi:hypothetical protein
MERGCRGSQGISNTCREGLVISTLVQAYRDISRKMRPYTKYLRVSSDIAASKSESQVGLTDNS